MEAKGYLRLTEAAHEYGVSRNKLWLLVRDGTLKAYRDPRDKRVTLLSREELEDYLRIRPKEKAAEE